METDTDSNSKKRRGTDETIFEAESRIKDEYMVAKGNRKALISESKNVKSRYKALLLDYNNGEKPNLKADVERAKNDMDQIKADIAEADNQLLTVNDKLKAIGAMDQDENNSQVGDDQEKDDEIEVDLMIAQENFKALQSERTRTKAIYDALLHDYNDGEKPKLKADVQKAEKEMNQVLTDISKEKAQIKSLKDALNGSGNGHNSDAGDKIEKGVFVPMDGAADPVNPGINVTGPEEELKPSVKDDPEDLWSPEIARKKAGLAPDHFRMEGWKGGRAKTIITGRGPENASSFRMERESAVAAVLEEDRVADITLGRFGEMKYNKKFVYGKQNHPVIQGVAWFTGGVQDPLSLLIPKPRAAPGVVEVSKAKTPRLELAIKVKWIINNAKQKSWETRTTIRRLWGYETADLYIYEAAKEQERRYTEWQNGERPALDRSPTPGVVPNMPLDPENQNLTPKPATLGLVPNMPLNPGNQNLAPKPAVVKTESPSNPVTTVEPKIKKETAEKSPMMNYKEMWCELNDIDSRDMEEQDQASFLRAWQLYKATE